MKLVKDYINDRTLYYWIEDTETLEPLSPQFRTFVQAEEWWKESVFSQFRGTERRLTTQDRRQDHENRSRRSSMQDETTLSTPRRVTDLTIQVDIDLHQEKAK